MRGKLIKTGICLFVLFVFLVIGTWREDAAENKKAFLGFAILCGIVAAYFGMGFLRKWFKGFRERLREEYDFDILDGLGICILAVVVPYGVIGYFFPQWTTGLPVIGLRAVEADGVTEVNNALAVVPKALMLVSPLLAAYLVRAVKKNRSTLTGILATLLMTAATALAVYLAYALSVLATVLFLLGLFLLIMPYVVKEAFTPVTTSYKCRVCGVTLRPGEVCNCTKGF